ncbi:MAG: fatty acid oxidation complex subunit alpha FadJ, partial [Calditrichaeota bacterium]
KKRTLDPEIYTFLGVSGTRRIPQEHIQQRLIYLMINEAAYCLEEGIASRPRDVDVGVIFGLGFPPFRGGLLRYADAVGIPAIHEKLSIFAREFGSYFTPAPLLQRLAEKEHGFYEHFGGKPARKRAAAKAGKG